MKTITVGVLAFQGDVEEHIRATEKAAARLKRAAAVRAVRTREDLRALDALIIPGGESTTLQKLCEREGMLADMKKIKNIFGTCAGAILLSKTVHHKTKGQKTLALMDIEVDRNAYGKQNESFEENINTPLGAMNAIFIRAPRITRVGTSVKVLARNGSEVVACEERVGNAYYLAFCFHPELTSTVFHEYFLRGIQEATKL